MASMWHITLPAIMPTIVVLMILNVRGILGSDTQKILLMYNPSTYGQLIPYKHMYSGRNRRCSTVTAPQWDFNVCILLYYIVHNKQNCTEDF